MADQLADQVASVGALVEPARRALYQHVTASTEPVSREEAAQAVGVPVHSAKFHLDRLVAEGLLDVEFRRTSGRTGPRAGRPAKLYRRSARELSVSLPERRYDLAGAVLAEAVESSLRDGTPITEAVDVQARRYGRTLASQRTSSEGDAPAQSNNGVVAELAGAATCLARLGYEPRTREDGVSLGNCPFHRLAAGHSDLVCGLNLELVRGILEGLGARSVAAQLVPAPGMCCVRVEPAP